MATFRIVALAVELARASLDLFTVAGTYDLEDFSDAVEHAARPGRRGAVLLSGPR